MKNLKKLISVVIAVIMIVGSFATVSAADYKDVESTNSFYKAINVLSGLGIVNGDDEGNFNPKNDIKRSEMVALVCRMMGEEDIATNSASNAFTDVAANHWAAGNIAWGVNRGIINGMGDGTFAPDASVSYQDAVVMIMRALGYDRIAQRAQNGGYPAGYLKLASQRGVLKDAGYDNQAAAPREVVAQLIYNAMTAPLVDVKQYGMNVEDDRYIIHDGSDVSAPLRTLLTYTNDFYKVKANVTATAKTSSDLIDKEGNYKVTLEITNTYGYDFDSICNILGADEDDKITVYAGETEAADLLGATVEAYLVEDEDLNNWKLLAVVADAKSVRSETLKAAEVDFKTFEDGVFTYEDAEGSEEEIELADTYTIYYNGDECDTEFDDEDAKEALLLDAEEITFSGSRTGAYNKVFVTDYAYFKVTEVFAEDLVIATEDAEGTAYDLDLNAESPRDKKFTYGLFDGEGNEISLADIAEDDILNIVAPLDVDTDGSVDLADLDDIDYMDIYVTDKVVTGAVTEDYLDDVRYAIDGTVYKVVEELEGELESGKEGSFFITIDGRILAEDTSASISKNFAFLVAAYSEGKYGDTVFDNVIRLFTADGKVADYKVAKKLTVDGETQEDLNGDDGYIMDTLNPLCENGDVKADVEASLYTRFVTYKLNSNGEIKELTFVGEAAVTETYDEYVGAYGSYDIDDASILFVAPVSVVAGTCNADCATDHNGADDGEGHKYKEYNVDQDDLSIGSFDAMKHDNEYDLSVVSFGDDMLLTAALMSEEIIPEFAGSHLAVVQARASVYDAAAEDGVTQYTLVQSGEAIKLAVDPDADSELVYTDLTAGDVILYSVGANGMIKNMMLVYDISEEDGFDAGDYTIEDDEFELIYGEVTAAGNGVATIAGVRARLLDGEGNTYASVDNTDDEIKAGDVKVVRSAGSLKKSGSREASYAVAIKVKSGFQDWVMITVPVE